MDEDKMIKQKLEYLKNYMYKEIQQLKKKILHEDLYKNDLIFNKNKAAGNNYLADNCTYNDCDSAAYIYEKHQRAYRKQNRSQRHRKYKRNSSKCNI